LLNWGYTYDDALKIQKRQYEKDKYLQLMDLKDGYSKKRMIEIIKDRASYLLSRGATLNNPHIPEGYLSNLIKIEGNYPQTLRNLVRKEI